ncbi:uncharacterized protein TNCV_2054541 [Trichonephila clavipes]|nr:uncharacterized protein TNCV_2054541 [Trichonephila clavipes]
MAPHTITPAVRAMCHCKAKAGFRRSPQGFHTQTRLSSLARLNLDSSLKTIWFHSAAVQFPCVQHHSKQMRRWVIINGSTHNGCRDPKCPSARHLRMVREDTGTLVKMLPVPGWWSMKQLVARMHFLRYGVLDSWSVEGILSLVFM